MLFRVLPRVIAAVAKGAGPATRGSAGLPVPGSALAGPTTVTGAGQLRSKLSAEELGEELWSSRRKRQLLNESSVIFQEVQKLARDGGPGRISDDDAISLSTRYRHVLRSCHDAAVLLRAQTESEMSPVEDDPLGDEELYFKHAELVWHLAEIFFLKRNRTNRASGLIVLALVEWIQRHWLDVNHKMQTVQEDIQATPHQVPHDYWHTVYTLLFHSRFDEVASLLSLHPRAARGGQDGFARVRELVLSRPALSGSVSQYFRARGNWQESCTAAINNRLVSSHPELKDVCALLAGDEHILQKIGGAAEFKFHWCEVFVAKLVLSNPLAKLFDLREDIKHVVGTSKTAPLQWAQQVTQLPQSGLGGTISLDGMIMAVMEQDAILLVQASSKFFAVDDGWWFACHMADLLVVSGLRLSSRTADLREKLILEFASALFSVSSLWSVGSTYLDSCPEHGLEYMSAFVERIPLDSDVKALKVLRLCSSRGLVELSESICRVMGRKARQQGRTGTAIGWFLRARDGALATQVADELLWQLRTSKSLDEAFEHVNMIEKFGTAMLLSERLTFLVKYREYHRLLQSRDFEEAASILVKVLNSPDMAPRWYWIDLVREACHLLRAAPQQAAVFNIEETQMLMRRLCDISLSHHSEAYLGSVDEAELVTDLETLRLALARNLAGAILSS